VTSLVQNPFKTSPNVALLIAHLNNILNTLTKHDGIMLYTSLIKNQ